MRNIRLQKKLRHGQDLRDPGLVVRAEQGGTVRRDQRMAIQAFQMRKELRIQHIPAADRQDASVVVLMQLRLHAFPAEIRRRVQMGNKADPRPVFISRCGRNRSIYIAMLIHAGIRDAHLLHLRLQHPGQVRLTLRAGGRSTALIACRPDPDIAQQSLICFHDLFSLSAFFPVFIRPADKIRTAAPRCPEFSAISVSGRTGHYSCASRKAI